MRHSRQKDIVGETRLAGHFGAGIDSAPRDTDHAKLVSVGLPSANWLHFRIFFVRHSPSCAPLFLSLRQLRHRAVLVRDLEHRGFDSFENLKISGTAAQVAGDCFADLIPRGVRILVQQSLRCYQNGWRAIATLRRPEIGESILQRVKISVFAEALDSQDLFSATLEREHQTRKHRLAIQKDGASAAFSELTAVFCACVTEILAQYLQQSFVGGEGNISLLAVERESYL